MNTSIRKMTIIQRIMIFSFVNDVSPPGCPKGKMAPLRGKELPAAIDSGGSQCTASIASCKTHRLPRLGIFGTERNYFEQLTHLMLIDEFLHHGPLC